jgi:tetratricopeptide (TPR) repeat protein
MEHKPGEILLGRYEVRAVLARGPTTVTYSALDVSSKRRVGVRHWSARDVPAARAIAELEREIALSEQVANVHVPRYIEHFSIPSEAASGTVAPRGAASADHYLVHDASEGRTLAQWAQAQSRGENELRAIAVSLLRALDALHRGRFVHGRVCADEILVRSDGRVFLMGMADTYDPRLGFAGDLRGLAETLSVTTRSALSPELRSWLQRLLSSDGARGFQSAAEALAALHDVPVPRPSRAWTGSLIALAALCLAGAVAWFAWPRGQKASEAHEPIAALAQPDLPAAITDTSFVPKAIEAKPGLRLAHVRTMTGHNQAVAHLAFDSTGTRLVSGGDDGSIIVWSVGDGSTVNRFWHSSRSGAVAFMGSQHVLSGAGSSVRIWDAPSGQVMREIPADSKRVTAVAATHAGRMIVASGYDGSIRVFDAETGNLLRLIQQPPKVYALAIDPLGEQVASAGDDKIVHVFRLADGAPLVELRGHTKGIAALVFLADGHTLASASSDRTVRLWDVSTGQQKQLLQGHRTEVTALAADPSGKLLASASRDGELRIWDAESGALLCAEQLDGRGLLAVGFGPDGERIALGGKSNRVDLYALVTLQASWRPPAVTAPLEPGPLPLPGHSPADKLVASARALIASGADARPEAGGVLREALALDPKNDDACLELARIDLLDGHYDEAEQSAKRCDQRNPGDPRAQAMLVEIAAAAKQDEVVLQRAHALIDSNPGPRVLAGVYAQLRQLYLRSGELDAAEEALRSEINLEPGIAERKLDLADFLNDRERYDEAIGWARAALAQTESRAAHVTLGNALAGKARLALEQDQRDAMDLWLGRAFAADPQSADGHYVRALQFKHDRDAEGVQHEMRAALAGDPHRQRAPAALR